MSTEEIKAEIKELSKGKKAEPFLKSAWFDADGEKESFLKELKRYSNFNTIEQALNRFGRKAQFIMISQFLKRMIKVYEKIEVRTNDNIKNYSLKAQDPQKLAKKIEETKNALTDIENKMNIVADEILTKYSASTSKGIISQRAEEVVNKYSNDIKNIKGTSNSSLEELEKLSYRQIDILTEFEEELQKKVVTECNKALTTLSNENSLEFITLKPDFSKEVVDNIKESMKGESEETYTYTTGKTFKETHTASIFSQDKYYNLVKKSIKTRIDVIKNQVIDDLRLFVGKTINTYIDELKKNSDDKKQELMKIKNEEKTAKEIQEIIRSLKLLLDSIEPQKKLIKELKDGIDGNV